jgi:hypothetical protein
VRGGDGKEYGPVSLEQLSNWIQQSRLKGEQEVKRSDMQYWAAANAFEELAPIFNSSTSLPSAPAQIGTTPANRVARPQTATSIAQMRSGASWFYWIAALSVVNSVLEFSGHGGGFLFGLGITQLIDQFASSLGTGGRGIAFGLDFLAAGTLVLLGIFGQKGHGWAFILGMLLYACDGIVFLLGPSWLGIGVHAFVLFCLFRGFMASRELKTAIRS